MTGDDVVPVLICIAIACFVIHKIYLLISPVFRKVNDFWQRKKRNKFTNDTLELLENKAEFKILIEQLDELKLDEGETGVELRISIVKTIEEVRRKGGGIELAVDEVLKLCSSKIRAEIDIEKSLGNNLELGVGNKRTYEKESLRDIVDNITQGVNDRIFSKSTALQFVLEELDAARQGNELAVKFAENSGFSPSQYEGAMNKSFEDVDGPGGPQQFLLTSIMNYCSDIDSMVNLRLQVLENVMQKFSLGKYEPSNNELLFRKVLQPKVVSPVKLIDIVSRSNQSGYIFVDIINDLGESVDTIVKHSKLIQMTYAYARRSAATALYIQGLVNMDKFDHNLAFFKAMQAQTEHSVEFQEKAFSDAIEYMQDYSPMITRLLIKNMALIAQSFHSPQNTLSDSELMGIVMDAYSQ